MMYVLSILASLLVAAEAHSIFQRISVDGKAYPNLAGVRAPQSDFPVYDVTDAAIACNQGYVQPVSTQVIEAKAGSKIGMWWGHVIGGAQYANDGDNPISPGHKGPVMTYLAKVDNAATASPNGLRWFKIQEEGLNNGIWGEDRVLQGKGWYNITMPSCISPGDYLMRHELIALHSAYDMKGAQFYMSCAQIRVTEGGSFTPTAMNTVAFPGAYKQNDPGIYIQIWVNGREDFGGKPYQIPGPRPITC